MILSVRDLAIGFRTAAGEVSAVDGLSFEVEEGEIFVIIGESGSGKSLTGMSITGLQPQTAVTRGSIRFEGRELLGRPDAELRRVRGREIAMIYQDPLGSLNPVWPVGDQIAEAITTHGLAGRAEARRRAVEMLAPTRTRSAAACASAR